MKDKKINKMDVMLLVIALMLIAFTVVMIVTFWHANEVPDVLITAVFGACIGECSIMGWIKNTNKKYDEYDEEE